MYGGTEFFLAGVSFISVFAAITDLIWGRIFNWLTFPALLIGLAVSFIHGGWPGLGSSLLGVLAGFILYGWMFALRFMGGGDVKLLMALGAWGGLHYAAEVAIMGVLVGGALALVMMVATGRIKGFSMRMYRYLRSILIKELEVEKPEIDQRSNMPFAIPIGIAAVWVAAFHPLEKWGIQLWP